MKKDYKSFVDNEIASNKELREIRISVIYKDGIRISYAKTSDEHNFE